MSNQVRVIDNISGSILFQTSIEKINDAYVFATLLETEGLDIRIETLGLTETLIKSLGANESEMTEHKETLYDDLDGYEDSSCSICPTTNLKIQK